jgi:hypothetical protein
MKVVRALIAQKFFDIATHGEAQSPQLAPRNIDFWLVSPIKYQ